MSNGIIILVAIALIAGAIFIIVMNQAKEKFKRKLKKEGVKAEKDFIDQATLDRIRNSSPEENLMDMDDLELEIDKSLQQIAISENLQEAADKRHEAATDLYTAEGRILQALGRQKTRIDKEKELNEEAVAARIEGENILAERQKLWDALVEQERQEISDKLEFGRKKIEADRNLSQERKNQKLEEIEAQAEIDKKTLEAKIKLRQMETQSEIEMQQRKDLADSSLKLSKQINDTNLFINEIRLKKAKGERKKSIGIIQQVLVMMTIVMAGMILQRLFF